MLQRSTKVIFISTISAILISVLFNELQKPVYRSEAEIEIRPQESDRQSAGDFIATQCKILTSQSIINKVSSRLGTVLKNNISAKKIEGTNIIQIVTTSDTGQKASDIASAVIEAYIEQKEEYFSRNKEALEKKISTIKEEMKNHKIKLQKIPSKYISSDILDKQLMELSMKLEDYQAKYTDRHPEVINLNNQIKAIEKQLSKIKEVDTEKVAIIEKIDDNEKLLNTLEKELKEVTSDEKETVQIILSPTLPEKPSFPNKILNMLIGGSIGILVGLFLTIKDRRQIISMKGLAQLESELKIKSVGIIPHIEKDPLLFYHSAKSFIAESYYTLLTDVNFSFRFSGTEKGNKVLFFTSALSREGKTLTAINFAIANAALGLKTLLIDANFQSPQLDKIFDLKKAPGLNEILSEGFKWKDVLQEINNFLFANPQLKLQELHTLRIITNGSDSSVYFELGKVDSFIDEIKKDFDLVIFDSSSIFLSAEASLLASAINNIILIYNPKITTKSILKRAHSMLKNINANIIGMVINDATVPEFHPRYTRYPDKYLEIRKPAKPQPVKKVLIVDDEQSVINTITRILLRKSKYDYEIASSSDGMDALKQIGTFKPDLLILDLKLPGFDGFEVCKRIRLDPQNKNMKIFAITGYGDTDTRERILSWGADEFLAKPFEIDKFMECINNLPE